MQGQAPAGMPGAPPYGAPYILPYTEHGGMHAKPVATRTVPVHVAAARAGGPPKKGTGPDGGFTSGTPFWRILQAVILFYLRRFGTSGWGRASGSGAP